METFLLFYNLCFPKIEVKHKIKSGSIKWLSRGIKTSCKNCKNLRYLAYKTKSKQVRKKYLNYSKILKKCIYKSQQINNTKFIQQSKNKSKAAWTIVKAQMAEKIFDANIDNVVINNNLITDKHQIAEVFNEKFIDLEKKSKDTTQKMPSISIQSVSETIFLNPVDEKECAGIIQSLNNTNAVGYDDINTTILKSCNLLLIPVLCYLINLSFTSGTFPDFLKKTIIKPLYKKGCRTDINNYRPIALIPIFSKIFEKAMASRLNNFFHKHFVIRPEQNGFQKQKSTTLATFSLIKEVIEYIDKGNHSVGIFFDMTKAFDYIRHDTLLYKCEKYGIRGVAYNWMKSYLCNRYQCVEISTINKNSKLVKYRSSFKHNIYGVPQGSILGPLTFLIQINDLPTAISHKSVLYADDVTLVLHDTDKEALEQKLNQSVQDMGKWLDKNNLYLNATKTKYIQFRNRKMEKYALTATYKNILIEETSTISFLGVILDEHCTWVPHVQNVCTKISRFIYVLYRIRKIADKNIALLAYYGYVESVLRYGLVIWGNSTEISKLFIIQKRCIRAIEGAAPLDSCKPLFKNLNILTLSCLYIYECACFVKKFYWEFKTAREVYNFSRRYSNKLFLPPCKTALFNKNCSQMIVKIYNKLPESYKSLPLTKFKKAVYNYLSEKCFYSIKDYFNDKY